MMRVAGALLLILGTVASAARAQPAACLDVAGRAVMKSRLDIALTTAGKSVLKSANAPLVFVHATRMIDGETSPEYVQMLGSSAVLIDPKDRSSVSFWFGHEGNYRLSLRGADSNGWPYFDQVGAEVAGCRATTVSIGRDAQPDFAGVRGHVWVAYRPATRGELGASLYRGRLGLATTVTAGATKSSEPNRVNGSAQIRWRGARGYLGGGVSYYPHDEPDRNRWRPAVVAGEELPMYRGKPIWFLLDLRFDDDHVRPWTALNLSFAVRVNLTNGDQP